MTTNLSKLKIIFGLFPRARQYLIEVPQKLNPVKPNLDTGLTHAKPLDIGLIYCHDRSAMEAKKSPLEGSSFATGLPFSRLKVGFVRNYGHFLS